MRFTPVIAALTLSILIPATVRAAEKPVNFANQVVPIFTKLGCNSGGCHGKASGQNGFKLSLFGFEPAEDYEYVVKEAKGRRVFLASPETSLLLLKATGTVAHGGGKRLDKDSPFYQTLLKWIEQATPYEKAGDPVVERIEVSPQDRVMERSATQQLTVTAHLSDGSKIDVTRLAVFESGSADLAEASVDGIVTTRKLPGVVAVMARFQTHVDVCRVVVPLGVEVRDLPPAANFIDEHVFAQLKKLGLPPSPTCDDGTFIRRATIDITGRLPTRDEVEQFLADKADDKHDKLIDRLLDSPAYAEYFANKWSAVLRNRRSAPNEDPKPTAAFHAWIRDGLARNKPYDQFVREVVAARGEEITDAPVIRYREVKDMGSQVEDTAQLFLGQRLVCAKCHHHPLEKWTQGDYWSMAAFFSRMEIKDSPAPKQKNKTDPVPQKPPMTVEHKPGKAQATHPKTNKPVKPAGLGGPEMTIADDVDPREKLADWMAEPTNPFFARALVNRYWKHFLGRGLVEPEDDLRVTNPASNPELLDALAESFVESKFDLKKLVRTICTARVYRLSALPNEHNADDRQNYSRYIPKRLNAEVLLDAIDDVTLSRTTFKGQPSGTRAVQLPDNQVESYFLSVFGRPDSASACECERNSDASLAQCLHMFNSTELIDKISGKNNKQARAVALAADKRPVEQRLRELYLVALSREPGADELKALTAYIDKKGNTQAAYEDIVWAVLNTKEFLFNH